MRSTFLLCVILLPLTASRVSAGGINLSWSDCGSFGTDFAQFSCATNVGAPFQLFASFDPTSVMADCVSNEWVLSISTLSGPIPAWWDFKGAGRCRDASMTMNTNFTVGPFNCLDPWAGQIGIQGFGYNYTSPASVRVVGVQSLPSTAPVQVDPGNEYYSITLVINRAKTTGAGSCAGCLDPVCLVLNEITIIGLSGEVKEQSPRDRNFVTWQPFSGPAPCAVITPVRYPTWGQMKSLYR